MGLMQARRQCPRKSPHNTKGAHLKVRPSPSTANGVFQRFATRGDGEVST